MIELGVDNTLAYLHDRGLVDRDVVAEVTPLAWGVSNVVLRVVPSRGEAFVVKQSRAKLRTRDPWFSRLERIWREADVMREYSQRLPPGVVPTVLFEDRDNFLFVMEAAPADHVVWKQRLLEGKPESRVADFLGRCLATMHRETAFRAADLMPRFGDRAIFAELRIDPFYRRVAAVSPPEVQPQLFRLIDQMEATQVCLVHADFSPKNVLLAGDRIVLVDFETGHYGDPAFDLGFFLSHLLLKAVAHKERMAEYAQMTTAFWRSYDEGVAPLASRLEFEPGELVGRATRHLAGCMWARIDGTSRIDYLPDAGDQGRVREFCQSLFLDLPRDWQGVLDRLGAKVVS